LDTYFFFANKKQAQGGHGIEGADVSFMLRDHDHLIVADTHQQDGFRYTY
jgi:hypothetical protein